MPTAHSWVAEHRGDEAAEIGLALGVIALKLIVLRQLLARRRERWSGSPKRTNRIAAS
jgi:uncharacterized protein (DUF2336 family)